MSDKTDGLKAIFYTDGGCRPTSRGRGGYGIHGYVFSDEKPKQGTGLKDWKVTSTGYVREEKGVKVEDVTVQRYLDVVGNVEEDSTNNEMELVAMNQAIEYALAKGLSEVTIYTDSEYVKKGLTEWLDGWVNRNWMNSKGEPVANRSHWENLLANRNLMEGRGSKLTIEWIRGHDDHLGNETADYNATLGVIAALKRMKLYEMIESDSKGYWNQKNSTNRMFANSYWYFNTNTGGSPKTADGRTIYHLGEHGSDDDFLGKPVSDNSFSVVYLKEPDPVLEVIRAYHDLIDTQNFNSIVIGRLGNLFKPKIYQEITTFQSPILLQPSQKLDLYTPDKKLQLTRELRPPLLAFNLLDVMSVLENTLNQAMEDPEKHNLVVTDITDVLYEVEEKKGKSVCKLKSEITSAVKSMSVKVKHNLKSLPNECDITLTVGIDTPDRNTLAALAARSPKVKVVTWKESDKAFRFATIVEAEEDIGIWAGFYSNLHLLTK